MCSIIKGILFGLFGNLFSRRSPWKIRVGHRKYFIQEILNDYELIGSHKGEITDYLSSYAVYCDECDPEVYYYEIKQSRHYKFFLILFFKESELQQIRCSRVKFPGTVPEK